VDFQAFFTFFVHSADVIVSNKKVVCIIQRNLYPSFLQGVWGSDMINTGKQWLQESIESIKDTRKQQQQINKLLGSTKIINEKFV
jgi:hypothetical protein